MVLTNNHIVATTTCKLYRYMDMSINFEKFKENSKTIL